MSSHLDFFLFTVKLSYSFVEQSLEQLSSKDEPVKPTAVETTGCVSCKLWNAEDWATVTHRRKTQHSLSDLKRFLTDVNEQPRYYITLGWLDRWICKHMKFIFAISSKTLIKCFMVCIMCNYVFESPCFITSLFSMWSYAQMPDNYS